MSLAIWIVLVLGAWTLGLLFALVLMRMAGDEDRAAILQERFLEAANGVVIQPGIGDLDAVVTSAARHSEWRDVAEAH